MSSKSQAQAARFSALDSSRAKGVQAVASASPAEERAARLLSGEEAPAAAARPRLVATSEAPIGQALGLQEVPLTLVHDNPFDARRVYRPTDVQRMADSLKTYGQQSPARGYWKDGKCMLFYGHQRKRAAIQLGWTYLKVDVVEPPASDQELYLVSRAENADRAEQTPLDDALVWHDLLEKGLYATQEELGRAVGVSQETVARTLAYAKLPINLMNECIDLGILNRTMLYALVQFHKESGNEETTSKLIKEIKDGGLSTREVEARTRQLKLEKEQGPVVVKKPRSDTHKISYGKSKGVLKEFVEKGRVELRMDGLDDSTRGKLIAQLKQFFEVK